jgi:hypothetical protein
MAERMDPDFDPGLRSSIELLYGPEAAQLGEIRGKTVRGRARYSPDEAIRAATRAILARQADDLTAFARRRPACGYVHGATLAECRDPVCQAWLDEIAAWHTERFGPRHLDLTLGDVLWLSTGRHLSLNVSDGRWRDSFDPAVVALDLGVNRTWVTMQVGIHTSATKADLHDLVDRLWSEVDELRVRARLVGPAVVRSNGRVGRLDRPDRATYWRLRQFDGLTVAAIADEWETLTSEWTEAGPDDRVDRRRLEYPAWLEWRHRGRSAGVERFEDIGSVQRAIAKLRQLTT